MAARLLMFVLCMYNVSGSVADLARRAPLVRRARWAGGCGGGYSFTRRYIPSAVGGLIANWLHTRLSLETVDDLAFIYYNLE